MYWTADILFDVDRVNLLVKDVCDHLNNSNIYNELKPP